MDLLVQIWAGSFYLLNKVFFSTAERTQPVLKRKLKAMGWIVYILGVPAWAIILIGNHNWIAASIEIGGVPAMLLGLYNVVNNNEKKSKPLEYAARFSTYAFIVFGVSYSLFEYGGINTLSQILEIGVMIGFLLGSYLLAKSNVYGWPFFMLMNVSAGMLMYIQDKPILAIQQALSLGFVIYGFFSMYQKRKLTVIK